VGFRRLVVTRSPALVWFGAIGFAGVVALENSVARGDDVVFATATFYDFWYVVFLLCIVRGLVGAWFSELWIHRDARMIKTCSGDQVAFEAIGALTAQPPYLLAEGVKGPLYRGDTAAVNERHDALAAVLGRGRLQLYSLKRLAHHVELPFVVLGVGGIIAVIGTTYRYIVLDGVHEIEYKLIEAGALVVSLALVRYGLVGSKTERQLRVDPIAGVLQLEDGSIKRFDELGALRVDSDNRLMAASFVRPLYGSYSKQHAQRRYDALQTAMLQHQLRRALEAPVVEGDAFRGVDIKHEVERIAGDSPHKRAALDALSKDPDPTIAERARALQ
jgi:hypothetical protein